MHRVVPWIPAAVWAAVLFVASSQATLGVNLSGGRDKLAHFGAYLILGFLLTRATAQLRLPVFLAIGAGILYGFLDELHQSTVPGRSAEVADWVADALGTIVGAILYLVVWRLRAGSEPTPEPAKCRTT
ncbi:MAG TPA: VanZ family protein [Longimicrobiaceae bacterium]|nr:VanZ family protein [Longimicrobiaceae bacterium]